MKISELIEELSIIQKEKWDLDVKIKYRDEWWEYNWYDDYIYFLLHNETIIL